MEESAVLFGLFFLLQVSLSEFPVVVGHEPVQASAGEDVVLPCRLEPPFDVSELTVEWTRKDFTVHLYRQRADNYDEQDEQFRNRTSMFPEEMSRGNISLKLTNVTEKDSGVYICYVPRLNSQVKRGNVNLTVNPQKNPAGRDTGGNDETEDDKKQSRDQTVVIVGGVVAVLVVFLVSTLIYYCKENNQKNKQKYDQRREGPDTEEKKPLESVHV